MAKKIKKKHEMWAYIFIALLCILYLYLNNYTNFFRSETYEILGEAETLMRSLLGAIIIKVIIEAVNNIDTLWLWLLLNTKYRNKKIRITASYLFRINIDGDYFLVLSSRIQKYVPAGGVYKMYPSAKGAIGDLGIQDDDLIPIDKTSKDDLRIYLPAIHVLKFVRWFRSKKNREVTYEREFFEEITNTGVLPKELFPFVRAEFDYSIPLKIEINHSGEFEIKIADIFTLILSEEQTAAFRKLQKNPDKRFLFATPQEIGTLKKNIDKERELTIGDNAPFILNQ